MQVLASNSLMMMIITWKELEDVVQLQLRLSAGFLLSALRSAGLVCRAGVFRGPEEVQRVQCCHPVMDRK